MNYRQKIIRIATFLGGIYFFLEFVLPEQFAGVRLADYDSAISDGFNIISVMALGLGLMNLLGAHGRRIVFWSRGSLNSVALIGGMLAMLFVTAGDWRASARVSAHSDPFFMLRDFAATIAKDARTPNDGKAPGVLPLQDRTRLLDQSIVQAMERSRDQIQNALSEGNDRDGVNKQLAQYQQALEELNRARLELSSVQSEQLEPFAHVSSACARAGSSVGAVFGAIYARSTMKHSYTFLYQGLFIALGSAMFSLLGFYMASAAYRAFRVKSTESALMMVAALLVMIGQVPFGEWVPEPLAAVRPWLLAVPNSAAFRAIELGSAVAGLVLSFRMWLSIESESFSNRGDRS